MTSRRATSLVELLVVMCIIGVLAGMLFTVFREVREVIHYISGGGHFIP